MGEDLGASFSSLPPLVATAGEGSRRGRCRAGRSQQLGTPAACASGHPHLAHQKRRIKLFALKTCNIAFSFQNNKAPKEQEAILLT